MYHDGQQSGFHGVNRHQRKEMNHQVAALTDVCGLTEQAGFDFLVEGWGQHGDESKIVWNRDVFHRLDEGVIRIGTSVPWKRGTSQRHSVEFPWVLLEHLASGLTVLRPVVHVPAHRSDRNQRIAGDEALAKFGVKLARLQSTMQPDYTDVTGDGNVDFRLSKNVRLFEKALAPAGLQILVPPKKTIRGVLGRRIELYASDHHPREGLSMMPWLEGYDHRGVKRRVTT